VIDRAKLLHDGIHAVKVKALDRDAAEENERGRRIGIDRAGGLQFFHRLGRVVMVDEEFRGRDVRRPVGAVDDVVGADEHAEHEVIEPGNLLVARRQRRPPIDGLPDDDDFFGVVEAALAIGAPLFGESLRLVDEPLIRLLRLREISRSLERLAEVKVSGDGGLVLIAELLQRGNCIREIACIAQDFRGGDSCANVRGDCGFAKGCERIVRPAGGGETRRANQRDIDGRGVLHLQKRH